MLRYTLRRLAWLPIILFGVSAIAFFVLRGLPGQDPAAAMAGQGATDEQLERIREDLGLNRPLWEQYTDWLGDLVRGDFGREFRSEKPIREEFARRFPASFEIVALSVLFGAVFGIGFGILSAMFRNGKIDYTVRFGAVTSNMESGGETILSKKRG